MARVYIYRIRLALGSCTVVLQTTNRKPTLEVQRGRRGISFRRHWGDILLELGLGLLRLVLGEGLGLGSSTTGQMSVTVISDSSRCPES